MITTLCSGAKFLFTVGFANTFVYTWCKLEHVDNRETKNTFQEKLIPFTLISSIKATVSGVKLLLTWFLPTWTHIPIVIVYTLTYISELTILYIKNGPSSDDDIRLLKQLTINSKKEYHQWLHKNHPDKNNGANTELCVRVIRAAKNKKW